MIARAVVCSVSSVRASSVACRARYSAAASSMAWKGLQMQTTGEPLDVLQLNGLEAQDPSDGQVLVKMIAAPVNPSDINTVQGKYPLQPKYDAVLGHEGVGQVMATGGSTGLQEGDLVVPITSGLGTWRTHGVYAETEWHKVPSGVRIEDAATATINPATALSMLEKFQDLKSGDVVVQNGANSAVGKHVIQLCKHMGVKTVNVVRDRPDLAELEAQLKGMGGDIVVTPENVRERCKAEGMAAPKLALNCVGGESATTLSKMLKPGGTIVTYGGMSMKPVTIPTPVLIFKDIEVRGFWISGGETSADPSQKAALIDRVIGLMQQGVIKAECTKMPLEQWQDVMKAVAEGSKGKFLLTMC